MFDAIALFLLGGIAGHVLNTVLFRVILSLKEDEIAQACGSDRSIRPKAGDTVVMGYFQPLFASCSAIREYRDWFRGDKPFRVQAIHFITAVATWLVIMRFGLSPKGLAGLFCLYCLILLAFTDKETGYLPDCLTYAFLLSGLLANIGYWHVPPTDSVLGAFSGYGTLWMLNTVYRKCTGEDGMGHGDFKMIAGLGAWFGWLALPFIIMAASLMAILTECFKMAGKGRRMKNRFPFGPYLAIAALPVLLYGEWLTLALNDFS